MEEQIKPKAKRKPRTLAVKQQVEQPTPEPVKQPDNWDKAETWGMKNIRPTVDKWYSLHIVFKILLIYGAVCLFPPLAAVLVLWGVYRWLKWAAHADPESTASKVVVGIGAAVALHELKKTLKK